MVEPLTDTVPSDIADQLIGPTNGRGYLSIGSHQEWRGERWSVRMCTRPLFFLDYIAAATLDAELVADVVGGMAAACEVAGCTLLGGETAEMPGVYAPGAFDIAGTLVGVGQLVPGSGAPNVHLVA